MTDTKPKSTLPIDVWFMVFGILVQEQREEESDAIKKRMEKEQEQEDEEWNSGMPPTSRRRIGLGCVARMVTPWQVYNFLARVRFRSTQVSRFLGKTQAEKGWDPDRLPPKFQAWLRSLRLLSRNFYTMITPHLYKEFDLSGDKQIRNFVGSQSPVLEIVKENIREHSKQIWLPNRTQKLYWNAVTDLLISCKRLKRIVWSVSNINTRDADYISTVYVNAFLQNRRRCRVRIGLKMGLTAKPKDWNLCGADDLDMNKEKPKNEWSARREKGHIGAGSSQTLEYFQVDYPQPSNFTSFVPFGTRFPAMTELDLRCEDSMFSSAGQYSGLWDFSRLRSLSISSPRSLQELLEFVPLKDLSKLRKFQCNSGDFEEYGFKQTLQTQSRLCSLFDELQDLETLGWLWGDFKKVLSVKTICKVGGTLRTLRLRHSWDEEGYTSISVTELSQICDSCPQLERLMIEGSKFPYQEFGEQTAKVHSEAKDFLRILTRFEALERLYLVYQTSLGTEYHERSESTDPDYDDAEGITRLLNWNKLGVPFKKIDIELNSPRKPSNFRRIAGAGHGETGHWSSTRRFMSLLQHDGNHIFSVKWGSARVGVLLNGIDNAESRDTDSDVDLPWLYPEDNDTDDEWLGEL